MAELKPVTLFYHPGSRSWSYHARETNPQDRTFFWGASLAPVRMGAHTDPQPPPGALPLKALAAPGSRLGPLIGILSAESRDGSLKGNFRNYRAIMEAGQRSGGLVFAFGPGDVDWGRKTIRGKVYARNLRRWVTCLFPFPNVVYNRIQDRAHERKESSQSCIRRFLAHPGITLYNRGFFNKGEVLSLLSRTPKLQGIPETRALLSKADLVDMGERHKALYLKPANNCLGTGILRVARTRSRSLYTLHYFAHDKYLAKSRPCNLDRLWDQVQEQMIPSPYIVQQAIPLATVSGCPFDCRVLVQKNHKGRWQISGLGIRIAGHPESLTTHVPRGGRLGSPLEVLPQAFPGQKPARIVKRVRRLCLAVAKKLEEHNPHLGEMSIDAGLDRRGRPWLFEANAKPMKFDEPDIREQQLTQVIRFARFLTFRKHL